MEKDFGSCALVSFPNGKKGSSDYVPNTAEVCKWQSSAGSQVYESSATC